MTPEALRELQSIAAFLPGGTLKLTDLANDQAFRRGQSARIGGQIDDAQATRQSVVGETRSQRDKTLAPLDDIIRRGGNIISQREVDQMAARLFEQNNAASQSRTMAIEDRAASTGAAPGAVSESLRREGEANTAANATATRDLDIANALNRAQTLLSATQQRGQFGLGFQGLIGDQELNFMDLIRNLGGEQAIFDQPVAFSPLANEGVVALDTLLARLSGAESNLGAQFAALSQHLPGLFEQLANERAAEAARPSSGAALGAAGIGAFGNVAGGFAGNPGLFGEA
jgi:hypothetical protein